MSTIKPPPPSGDDTRTHLDETWNRVNHSPKSSLRFSTRTTFPDRQPSIVSSIVHLVTVQTSHEYTTSTSHRPWQGRRRGSPSTSTFEPPENLGHPPPPENPEDRSQPNPIRFSHQSKPRNRRRRSKRPSSRRHQALRPSRRTKVRSLPPQLGQPSRRSRIPLSHPTRLPHPQPTQFIRQTRKTKSDIPYHPGNASTVGHYLGASVKQNDAGWR